MKAYEQFYINGEWVDPVKKKTIEVINPATEDAYATISIGSAADVDKAVAAAQAAFPAWSQTTVEERLALMERIVEVYKGRYAEVAEAVSDEMGAPIGFANKAQAAMMIGHFKAAIEALKTFEFHEDLGPTRVFKEPIGVCGMITPWNWPVNQIACKVAPALATGCTMVLKPSEIAPIDAYLITQVLHDAGVPAGVFNMVNGDGPGVGTAISSHPGIDMVSFTGSTRAGILVAKNAADSVKRVCQELGGKSANILLDDADFEAAVTGGVLGCFSNTGQSCNAPTRMLVPAAKMDEVLEIARRAATKVRVGDPRAEGTTMGPVVSKTQFDKIQGLIQAGIDEGAELVCGGVGLPDGIERGYFVQPTIFGHVSNEMTIAREEIFGPVLSIIGYDDDEDAIRIANDTVYGLSGYITGGADQERVRKVASRIRTGMIHLNGSGGNPSAPFGGYKQSGNGREWGGYGFHDYLEIKSVHGYNA